MILGSNKTVAEDQQPQIKILLDSGATVTSAEPIEPSSNISIGLDSVNNNQVKRALLLVNTKNIPTKSNIIEAELHLKVSECSGSLVDVNIGRIISTWVPSTLTWKDKPGFSTPNSTISLDCMNGIAIWDITTIVKSWHEGRYENWGLTIYGPEDTGNPDYFRKFNLTDENSFVQVTYELTDNPIKVVPEKETDWKKILTYVLSAFILLLLTLFLYYLSLILRKILKHRKSKKKKIVENKSIVDLTIKTKSIFPKIETPKIRRLFQKKKIEVKIQREEIKSGD
jgi:hypothetical protein